MLAVHLVLPMPNWLQVVRPLSAVRSVLPVPDWLQVVHLLSAVHLVLPVLLVVHTMNPVRDSMQPVRLVQQPPVSTVPRNFCKT